MFKESDAWPQVLLIVRREPKVPRLLEWSRRTDGRGSRHFVTKPLQHSPSWEAVLQLCKKFSEFCSTRRLKKYRYLSLFWAVICNQHGHTVSRPALYVGLFNRRVVTALLFLIKTVFITETVLLLAWFRMRADIPDKKCCTSSFEVSAAVQLSSPSMGSRIRLPIDAASHPRRTESWSGALYEHSVCHPKYNHWRCVWIERNSELHSLTDSNKSILSHIFKY